MRTTADKAMFCWNPGTSEVAVVRWPDDGNLSSLWECTGGACWDTWRAANFEQRKACLFIEAMHLIIRDKCDPSAVHKAFCCFDEYADGLSLDVKGARHK